MQFNKDIEAEAKNHPEIELIITDGQDKTEKQVADVENLIAQQVDVLLISPRNWPASPALLKRRSTPRFR